jgi:uncharacterized protein (DUF302 family)
MAQNTNPWAARLDTRFPYRVWMTGSIAVVMAALWTLRGLPDDDKTRRVLRHSSPYSVSETVLRIEAAAAERGLAVLLSEAVGTTPVIVLASAAGGTPVLMGGPDGATAVPMAMQVRSDGSGRAEVWVPDAQPLIGRMSAELPAEVAAELAALPAWLDRALSG